MLSALASCKKETIEPESKIVTLEAICENCTVNYTYGSTTKTEAVKGSVVVTFRVNTGSALNVSMKPESPTSKGSGMTLKVISGDKEVFFRSVGTLFPIGEFYHETIKID